MAVTKMLHMKQGKRTGSHLKNAIVYILNEEKTKGGLLVDSNCGTDAGEIFRNMIETKKEFGKLEGRQGYHFILSFLPGEGDEETVYRIGNEFAEKYLQNRYDYVSAVHVDKEHLHVHLIFNSVSYDGYKYHYANGDWERYIQPVTNGLARKYGLSEIILENLSQTRKKERTVREQVKKDLDTGIEKVASYAGLLQYMRALGYEIRTGQSAREGEYLSIKPKDKKAVRSFRLGKRYSPAMLRQRIALKKDAAVPPPKMKMFRLPKKLQVSSLYQLNQFRKYYRTIHSPYWKTGYTSYELTRLWENCSYLLRKNIRTEEELAQRLQAICMQEKELYIISSCSLTGKEKELLARYRNLEEEIRCETEGEAKKLLLLEREEMEQKEPVQELLEQDRRIREAKERLQVLKEEKRMARRIQKMDIRTTTEKMLEKAVTKQREVRN